MPPSIPHASSPTRSTMFEYIVWFHEIGPRYDCYLSNSLILCHGRGTSFFSLRLSILRPKSLWKLKGNMFPVRMLLIRRDSIKNKYQNGSLTSQPQIFFCPKFSIFFDLKIFHFSYNFEWKFSIFLDRKIFENFDLKIFHFRNFSFKIVWKWKNLRSKKIENFRSKKFPCSKIFIQNCMKNEKIWDRKKSKIWVRKNLRLKK